MAWVPCPYYRHSRKLFPVLVALHVKKARRVKGLPEERRKARVVEGPYPDIVLTRCLYFLLDSVPCVEFLHRPRERGGAASEGLCAGSEYLLRRSEGLEEGPCVHAFDPLHHAQGKPVFKPFPTQTISP